MPVKANGRLIVRTLEIFQDVEDAEKWLSSPNRLLHGETPLKDLTSLPKTC